MTQSHKTPKPRQKKGFFHKIGRALSFPMFVAIMAVPCFAIMSGSYVANAYGGQLCGIIEDYMGFKRYGAVQMKPSNVVRVRKDDDEPKICIPKAPAAQLFSI